MSITKGPWLDEMRLLISMDSSDLTATNWLYHSTHMLLKKYKVMLKEIQSVD